MGMADDGLLSHDLSIVVPSALRGLTTVFGMGTGVAPARWSAANLRREPGIGNREPGIGEAPRFSIPDSPFPIPGRTAIEVERCCEKTEEIKLHGRLVALG